MNLELEQREGWYESLQWYCHLCGQKNGLVNHHVIYRAEVQRCGGDVWDSRNAITLCSQCHEKHHSRHTVICLAALRNENIEFAFELKGSAAYNYLTRRYEGDDPRVDVALMEYSD